MTALSNETLDCAEWVLCPRCLTRLYGKKFVRELNVCTECGHHEPISAGQRLAQLADHSRYERLVFTTASEDPLDFVDTVPYQARLAAARERTGMDEAVLCARASVDGNPLIIATMDFRFMGGSLSSAVGEQITLAAETSLTERLPLLIVTSSGGARMQEGMLALMQMVKTSAALGQLDEAGILSVSLIADPTFGGVAASFATLTDVIIAEPGARLGFAGRRVIEQTIRQQLPSEFQTAEFLLERGFIDMIVPRSRLRYELSRLLRAAGRVEVSGGHAAHGPRDTAVVHDPDVLGEPDSWNQVNKARKLCRLTALDYFALAFEDFQELHGDRVTGQCPAVVGGTARLGDRPVMVIGHQKGHSPEELMQRNFGMPTPAGYRKAARLMRLANKLGLPVITLVDTPGAYPGADAEERGQAVAIAENLRLMMSLRVPVLTVIISEGGSGGALALAVANRVLMFANSIYSVISPEGCAAIIWKDPAAAPLAAEALRLTSRDLLRLGVVDGVLLEPEGGTGSAPLSVAEQLRDELARSLRELDELTDDQLIAQRQSRFRRYGAPDTLPASLPFAETT